MGWLTSAMRSVGKVAKIPGVGMIPGLGQVASGIGLATSAYGAYKGIQGIVGGGGGGPALPALPGMPSGGGGSVPGPMGVFSNPSMGKRSIFRNDPNIIAGLKPWAISKGNLKVCYRAPKGFVIRYDEKGDAFGIPKNLAKQYLGWKAAPKPPISVRDWHSLKRAGNVIEKFKDIEKEAKKIANFHGGPSRRKPSAITMVEKGGKFVALKG